MYITNIEESLYSNKILAGGFRLYELLKLTIKRARSKDNNSKEYLPYILNAVSKGYTVLDIGSHKRAYFFDLFKISKLPGKLIAFEMSDGIFSYLRKMKRLMKLQNVTIEHLSVSNTGIQLANLNSSFQPVKVPGATVINFKTTIIKEENQVMQNGIIDDYCSSNFIIPALIKFKLEGNELRELHSAGETLRKYKPQVLVECSQGKVTQPTLTKTFKLLTDLHYKGYFILDTLKVPLANFDFNIYQNEVLGFYCTNFIFE